MPLLDLTAPPLSTTIADASAHTMVPIAELRAVLTNESGNPGSTSPYVDPNANSGAAQGIAQFTPGTAAQFHLNPWDPIASIYAEAQYLAQLAAHYGGDYSKATAAYNAGPGAIDAAIANATAGGNASAWLAYAPAETQKYVANVSQTLNGLSGSPIGSGATAPGTVTINPQTGQPMVVQPLPPGQSALSIAGNAASGWMQWASAALQDVSLEFLIGSIAIALIAGGFVWLAASNPTVQSDAKTAAKGAALAA